MDSYELNMGNIKKETDFESRKWDYENNIKKETDFSQKMKEKY